MEARCALCNMEISSEAQRQILPGTLRLCPDHGLRRHGFLDLPTEEEAMAAGKRRAASLSPEARREQGLVAADGIEEFERQISKYAYEEEYRLGLITIKKAYLKQFGD